MSNMTGKFLSQKQMAEAKRQEARANAIQKREGTNFPLSEVIAFSCGCCIGPVIKRYDQPILSASEADEVLKRRKIRKNKKLYDFTCLQDFLNRNE